jgi:hypothetical protein
LDAGALQTHVIQVVVFGLMKKDDLNIMTCFVKRDRIVHEDLISSTDGTGEKTLAKRNLHNDINATLMMPT